MYFNKKNTDKNLYFTSGLVLEYKKFNVKGLCSTIDREFIINGRGVTKRTCPIILFS